MSHEISHVSGKAEMFYYGNRPWHGLGTPVEHALTAEEALNAASLSWSVEKRQIHFKNEQGEYYPAQGFVTVRTDANIPLGIVGRNYIPIQNSEAFTFLDTLTTTGEAKYHTAGALFQGQRVWILAKLPDHIVVRGDDVVDKYLLLVNNHDGKGSLKMFFTPIRVVCMNTLNQALSTASVTVNIAHRGNIQKKVETARETLGIAISYFAQIEKVFKDFVKRELTNEELTDYILNIIPGGSTRAVNVREKIHELCEVGAGSEYACGTVWGAYNAVAEYVDHHRTNYYKKPDRHIETINFGSGADIKTKAFIEAKKLVYN
jgi:phage/plasmid-like protein (TIGR03299 family)